SPIALELRAGVHTGPAVVTIPPQGQEPVTLGSTLDLAMELQSLAEPGCVILSPATCSLIAKSFALAALPAVRVPGLTEPITPHRVLEPRGPPEDGPEDRPPLVGRGREMDLLLSRWNLAREGNGQMILIGGEAGIGKSRLVLGLRERLDPSTAQWASCFGTPYTQSSPLQPVVGWLRQVLLRGDGDSPLDRLASALRDVSLADAVPLLAPLLDLPLDDRYPALQLTPESRREKTLDALASLVVQTAERQPLVLLIEDLQWLDPTTRAWLDRLIDQVASAPLLLLLTLRLHTLEVLWGPRAHLTQITLNPLNDTEAEQVVERVAGERPLAAAVRRQIVARTDGVPLFLEELTKAVLESPASVERQELPATLRDSLAERLDRLGTAKEIAQVAAVIGRVFSLELLAAVCGRDEAALQGEIRRLVKAELVYRKGFGGEARYLFKHALVQDAAYESLLKRERQQIHQQIADALATRFGETAETAPEILAHHYTEAGLSEPAIDFWVRAGELASSRSASLEAISHLDRALALLQGLAEGPERDRRELKIQNLRAAAIITGRGYADPEVDHAYCRAEVLAKRLEEAEEHFWAVLGRHICHVTCGDLTQGLGLAERLLQIAEGERRPGLLSIAWFSLGVYHFWQSDYTQALAELERAAELAPSDDDSYRLRKRADLRVLCRCYAAMTLWHLGQLDRARQRQEQAIALARQLGAPFTLLFADTFGASLAYNLGDAETVRRLAREVYDLALELGFYYFSWQAPLWLAWSDLVAPVDGAAAIELPDFDSLQRVIVENAGATMAYYSCLHAEILVLRERPGDAWRALDEGLRVAQARGVSFWVEEIHRVQGEILLSPKTPDVIGEGDRSAAAERRFQTALELARRHGSRSLALRAARSLGRLWRRQGRTQAARELVAQAEQGFATDS
ncbi:MAG TPA: AAA family ATPase, partial [Solirubrobacterales bacterium]|nr:AAA family ATPase [Solirubrobacterales bacterium]